MKAAANGVPNCSILDGWWIEGWQEGDTNGWGIAPSNLTGDAQDEAEANAFYDAIEQQIVPLYYHRASDGLPHDWIALSKEAIRTVAPNFSARRMLIDYVDKQYARAAGVAAKVPVRAQP
jgi:starch phosphorylase